MTKNLVSEIKEAESRIRDYVRNTPLIKSNFLSQMTGAEVYLKLENLQMTGSFKERGAINKLLISDKKSLGKKIITASAGNHAQGVAYGAQRLGLKSLIVMPEKTALIKVASTKNYGAEVLLHGNNYDEAEKKAKELAKEKGYFFIHPFDDWDIIAGQGSIGVEITKASKKFDVLLCPVGGGGLISGVSTILKQEIPKIKIIAVEPKSCAALSASLKAKKRTTIPGATTLAEGLAVRTIGKKPFEIISKTVDDLIEVEDNDIANAILSLLEHEKILVEGAGAVGVSALIKHASKFKNKKVLTIISGGNIDVNRLSRIIARGLSEEGRIFRVTIELKDVPGTLSELSDFLEAQETNILDITHHRVDSRAPFGFVDVTVKLETRGSMHIEKIKAALKKQGYRIDKT